jgi:predicted nucleic acid-binding protein
MSLTFDTNILVYTLRTPGNVRLVQARDLVNRGTRQGSLTLLLQSLTEFSYVALRKLRMDIATVERRVNAFRRAAPVHPPSEPDLVIALQFVRQHRIAFWDALMCATAERAGVRHLLTEDLQDGRRLGQLTIVNPFRAENSRLIDRILPP